jgi:hypothetical protein
VWGAGLLYEVGHDLKAEYEHYQTSGVHPKGGGGAGQKLPSQIEILKMIVDTMISNVLRHFQLQ